MTAPRDVPFEVLVADDDPDMRDLLAEFFRAKGMACATAHDGRAATKALEQSGGRFGLVLTDISMPGADGFAVLAAARVANPDAYVVMITGFAALDTAIQAVRSGAHDYLTKPFALGQLDVILARAITRLEARPERHSSEVLTAVQARLAAIEARLDGIESALADVLACVRDARRPR